jgi:hypothetical protein
MRLYDPPLEAIDGEHPADATEEDQLAAEGDFDSLQEVDAEAAWP